MGNTKYRFNPKTLTYEKIEKSFSKVLLRVSLYLTIVLIVALGLSAFFLSEFDTPAMKALRKENTELLTQYESLNEKLAQIENVLDQIQVRDDNIYRVVFNNDPIPESVRKAGFGGVDNYSKFESFDNNNIVLNTSKKIDIISKQAYIQAKSYEDLLSQAITKEKELSSIPAIMPLSNKDLTYTSSGWGMRMHPVYKVPRFHYGMDFVAPKGSPIYATGDGKVSSIQTLRTGHGKHVVIDHGFGYETLYAHLSAFNVKVGDKVKRGQVIGFVGSTGTSTASHLHYEVLKD
ncbi:MAG TPA: M23 family metallopeptidase, partial [Prolixibacteraceae bacterium]|nr:M23 family metallopeptidase [Prolixibacteraceae bacterium]